MLHILLEVFVHLMMMVSMVTPLGGYRNCALPNVLLRQDILLPLRLDCPMTGSSKWCALWMFTRKQVGIFFLIEIFEISSEFSKF
jgi:hypothetical protein